VKLKYRQTEGQVGKVSMDDMTGRTGILYAIDILPADDIRRRVPKSRQSAAASRLVALLEEACGPASATSRSHSRAVVAAVAGAAPDLSLGIDVEWMAPNRPFDEISQMVLPSAERRMDILTFYRGWTFFEAYYKAFQRFPEPAQVDSLIAHNRDDDVVQLSDGTCVTQFRVAGDFRGCVVWRHSATGIGISHL
jgi:hypothetical protein